MTAIIPAKDIGAQIFQMLVAAVDEEFQGESQAVKQAAIARILAAMAGQKIS